MPGCSIIGITKHKDATSIRGAMQHHLREIPTKNADPARRHLNALMRGPSNAADVARNAIDRAAPLVMRKDANRAVELLLAASDEFWENGGDADALGAVFQRFLDDEFGPENIIGMGLHLDEHKPHFWVILTPIYKGKLTSAHWFDGPAKLEKLHDRIAEYVKPLGMERARRGVKQTRIDMDTLHQANAGNPSALKRVSTEMAKRLKAAHAQADAILGAAKAKAATITAKASRKLQEALEREEAAKVRGRQLDTRETSLKVREANVQALAAALTPIEEERAARRLQDIKEATDKETRTTIRATSTRPPDPPPPKRGMPSPG
jgi:cell division septum initiation protein DivIVA